MKLIGASGENKPWTNIVMEQAATATINAALTVMGKIGYDTTILRAKLFDGTAIRKLLQDNDIVTSMSGGSTDAQIASAKAVYDAIAAAVATGTTAPTAFDASAAGGNFPTGATLATRYVVTVAGTVQGVILAPGDVFFAKVSSPSATAASDWVVLQANVDAATASVAGLIKLVTDLAELTANAGGNANKALTVAIFNLWWAANPIPKMFEQTGTSLAAGSTGVTHNLNSTKLIVQLRDSTGPVLADWTTSSANAISISSLAAVTGVTVTIFAIP